MYRTLFLWAAIWNLLAGGGVVLFPEYQFQLFYGTELPQEQYYTGLLFTAFGVSVLIFGLGYYLVSRAPELNRGIVVLGAIGKTVVFALFGLAFLENKVTVTGFAAAVGDFIWEIAFCYFLFQSRNSATAGSH